MSDKTPYETPQADLTISASSNNKIGEARAVDAGNGWSWLAEGFNHFKLNPAAWIFATMIWIAISMGVSLVPLLGFIAITVLEPLFAAGFMLGCQAQAENKDFQLSHLFAGFSKNPGQLFIIGVVYLAASFFIFLMIAAIVGGTLFMSVDMQGLQNGDPNTTQGLAGNWIFIALGGLLGLALFIPVMMLYWFAPVLVVLHDIPGLQAMGMSFRGCVKNILPFLVYGIIAILLTIVAAIPLFLGLLVVVPMIVASIFTAYRDIYFSHD